MKSRIIFWTLLEIRRENIFIFSSPVGAFHEKRQPQKSSTALCLVKSKCKSPKTYFKNSTEPGRVSPGQDSALEKLEVKPEFEVNVGGDQGLQISEAAEESSWKC